MNIKTIGAEMYWEKFDPIKKLSTYLNEINVDLDLNIWLKKGPEATVKEIDRQTKGENDAYPLVLNASKSWDKRNF